MQPTPIGKEKQKRMRRRHTQVTHEIFAPCLHAPGPLASPALGTVKGKGVSLDVPQVGEGDDHILFDNEVFVRNTINRVDDYRPSRITKTSHHFAQLVHDNLKNPGIATQQIFQIGDLRPQLLQLFDDFLPLHGGQRAQAHFENRLSLAL